MNHETYNSSIRRLRMDFCKNIIFRSKFLRSDIQVHISHGWQANQIHLTLLPLLMLLALLERDRLRISGTLKASAAAAAAGLLDAAAARLLAPRFSEF